MKKFSIIIPIYNEFKNIQILYDEIIHHLNKNFKFEIIFVNDGSIDDSKKIIKQIIKNSTYDTKLINLDSNQGQSFAVLSGIKNSVYDCIVTIDADLQNNPADIPNLINIFFNNDYSLVAGIRYHRKDSVLKKISSKIANEIRSFILKDDCIDTGCTLKVFEKNIFLQFPFFDGMHRFLPALFKGYGKKTFFVNVDHRFRIHGYTKYGTFWRMVKGIRDMIKVVIIIKKFKSTHD